MNEHTIQEGNRIIAEFWGYKLQPADTGWRYFFRGYVEHYYIENCNHPVYKNRTHRTLLKNMRFDIDWSWLMPVVEMIERMGYSLDNSATVRFNPLDNYDTSKIEYVCDISDNKKELVVDSFFSYPEKETKILATWFAVVQFIKWHNNKTK